MDNYRHGCASRFNCSLLSSFTATGKGCILGAFTFKSQMGRFWLGSRNIYFILFVLCLFQGTQVGYRIGIDPTELPSSSRYWPKWTNSVIPYKTATSMSWSENQLSFPKNWACKQVYTKCMVLLYLLYLLFQVVYLSLLIFSMRSSWQTSGKSQGSQKHLKTAGLVNKHFKTFSYLLEVGPNVGFNHSTGNTFGG